jgi:hypothetical protein
MWQLSQNSKEWLLALTLAMVIVGVGTVLLGAGILYAFNWLFDQVWPTG